MLAWDGQGVKGKKKWAYKMLFIGLWLSAINVPNTSHQQWDNDYLLQSQHMQMSQKAFLYLAKHRIPQTFPEMSAGNPEQPCKGLIPSSTAARERGGS